MYVYHLLVSILWYHVSGGVILPCDHLKHISSIAYMSLIYCTANLSLHIKLINKSAVIETVTKTPQTARLDQFSVEMANAVGLTFLSFRSTAYIGCL